MKSYIIYNSPDIGTKYKAKNLLSSLNDLGYDAELFDGVWHTQSDKFCQDRGINLYKEWIQSSEYHINKGTVDKFIRTSSTPQNKGCFCSHFLLWEMCLSQQSAICIFEYDAIIKSKLPINILDMFDEAIEICRAPVYDKAPYDKVNEDPNFSDYQAIDYPTPGYARGNSTGYILKPKGAEALINISKSKGYLSLDTMLNREWLDYKKLIPGVATKTHDYSVVNKNKFHQSRQFRKKLERNDKTI
tara:strand:- start:492 stop:1226 length:735 start_codon:yes stop_codon:yes gene_type:complete